MFSFIISLIVFLVIVWRMTTLFQINIFSKWIQEIRLNDGFCPKCHVEFKRMKDETFGLETFYICPKCNKEIEINFDSINERFVEDKKVALSKKKNIVQSEELKEQIKNIKNEIGI